MSTFTFEVSPASAVNMINVVEHFTVLLKKGSTISTFPVVNYDPTGKMYIVTVNLQTDGSRPVSEILSIFTNPQAEIFKKGVIIRRLS